MGLIKDLSDLRKVVGEEIPGLGDKNIDYLDDFALAFLERSPFLILSTADAEGNCDSSPKGDAPGFVYIEDTKTIVIPDRPGNKLAYGHQNILENPHVGLLFMIPGTTETLRINGIAELDASEALLTSLAARNKPAVLAIRVKVKECFFHCGKALIRSKLWTQASQAPHQVSFGKMYAKRLQASEEVADAIDDSIAQDYEHNL